MSELIPNVELAAVMAYAERFHRRFAAIALQSGDTSFAEQELAAAADDARTAGREYLLSLLNLVSGEQDSSGGNFVYVDVEFARSILITKQDVVSFVSGGPYEQQGVKLWNQLLRTRLKIDVGSEKPYTEMHYKDRLPARELSLSHLMSLLRYYDEEIAKDPAITPSNILGRNWGSVSVDLLRGLVKSRLDMLGVEQNPL